MRFAIGGAACLVDVRLVVIIIIIITTTTTTTTRSIVDTATTAVIVVRLVTGAAASARCLRPLRRRNLLIRSVLIDSTSTILVGFIAVLVGFFRCPLRATSTL